VEGLWLLSVCVVEGLCSGGGTLVAMSLWWRGFAAVEGLWLLSVCVQEVGAPGSMAGHSRCVTK
jgi:hypothetical protein